MSTIPEILTSETCFEYLKEVIDPEIYQNIVDLGLVYGVDVGENNYVDVTMTLTTPHCPMGPQIIADVEQTLKGKGATDVAVNIVWQPMWTPDAMTDELKRELGIDGSMEEEEEEFIAPPPPPPRPAPTRKKGFFGRLFGR
jgi:metal-sulfur cluster biosynthetic enzyme